MNSSEVIHEKEKFIDLILNCHSQSPRITNITRDSIMGGYESISNPESIIRDLILEVQKDLGMKSTRFN
jgi:hypothetical protein